MNTPIYKGSTVYTRPFGALKVVSVGSDVVTALYIERRVPFYGPLGRPGTRTTEVEVQRANCMTKDEWEYACWEGTEGAGRVLKGMLS